MGHTACLWGTDKLLIYGGENEHRKLLADLIIFDINTAYWTQPTLNGPCPRGRTRHAAVIHDDKFFVSGGMLSDTVISDEVCFLDLKTWTWSRSWRFVSRYDHSMWTSNGRLWVSGGMTEDMERVGEVWWLDLLGVPAFDSTPENAKVGPSTPVESADNSPVAALSTTSSRPSGYAANSSSIQISPAPQSIRRRPPVAPGAVSALRFVSSPQLPVQNAGLHFHVYSSGFLLDFATPLNAESTSECSLSAFDLDTLRWQKLAEGRDLFKPTHRWRYCCLNHDGTHAWLLGSSMPSQTDAQGLDDGEKLGDVLHIDLRKLGLLGNKLSLESRAQSDYLPASDSQMTSHLSSIGADLARTFDMAPETGSGTDFVITGIADEEDDADENADGDHAMTAYSQPIHVHRFLLSARWPHFARLWDARMTEFHTRKVHIPEAYSAVRAFCFYLYTDSITASPSSSGSDDAVAGPTLKDVAGMLVMSSIYDMPRLRQLCVSRLVREIDVQHAAFIFERASAASEAWLKRRAASFCMTHWGRIVRTDGFRYLPREAMLELCEGSDAEARIVGADELEAVGGLGGGRLGHKAMYRDGRKRGRTTRHRIQDAELHGTEDEAMDME